MPALRWLSALLLVLALAAGAAVWLQRQEAARMRTEMASLRDDSRELAKLRAENQRLAAAQPSETELARLRADHAAVLRMRGEIESLAARTPKIAGAGTATEARPDAADPMVNAGKAAPAAAAKTVRWAINGGAPDVLAATLAVAPGGREMLQTAFDGLPPERRARYGTPERMLAELLCATTQNSGSDQVLVREELPGVQGGGFESMPADGADFRTIHTRTQGADGRVRDSYQVFQSTPDGWRWVVSPGLVLKRLVETGLRPAPSAAK